MEITEVKIFPVSEEKLKAFVSIVIDSCFMVNDIKVIHGRDGLFISMPSRRKKNGEFKDVAHPLNNVTRRAIETRVLREYDRVLAERGERPVATTVRPIPSKEPEPPPTPLGTDSLRADQLSPGQPSDGRTLKEVEELHLRDSFWSVP